VIISKNYKPTVSALILNKDNKVLLTHNKSHGPDFWKLPQGGVESGESLEEAIRREVKEELNSTSFSILKQSKIEYKYDWPKEIQEKKGFIGPKITFFILRCENQSTLEPNKKELDRLKWVNLDSLPSHFSTLPDFINIAKKLVEETKQVISLCLHLPPSTSEV
jgi:8-oxo-dGTP pyrophosphatase MutT (NUDIX family)